VIVNDIFIKFRNSWIASKGLKEIDSLNQVNEGDEMKWTTNGCLALCNNAS
jgi:hypothetical protein